MIYIVKVKQSKSSKFFDFFAFNHRQDAISLQYIISDRFYRVRVCEVRSL